MATKTVDGFMQPHRGTVIQLATENPILAQGQMGFETDTGKFKLGDGTKAWVNLEYFNPGTITDTNTKRPNYCYWYYYFWAYRGGSRLSLRRSS